MKYFDIHGHLNFAKYDGDREEAISRARELGVGMITVGTDHESSKRAVELAEKHKDIWATVGIHPTEVNATRADAGVTLRSSSRTPHSASQSRSLPGRARSVRYPLDGGGLQIAEFVDSKKVVAIGECGLDYFHSKSEDIENQKKMFEEHIVLANEVNKPLMLHIRNGKTGGNAYQEAIKILNEHAKVRANFHFFAGTIQDLKDILDMGGTVSFTGVITFTSDYDELVKYAPLGQIMSETDCPFVAPTPHRGKRNEPVFVVETVKAMARIRGGEEAEVAEQLARNATEFFNLTA